MKHYGDIMKINGAAVEPVNVVIGGSPCQDLSVAGKQAGLQGERSGLFMEQLRVIKEMRRADNARGRTGKDTRPRYMVWENVPGAFSSNKGADFSIVLQETAKVACEQAPAVPIPKNGWPPAGCNGKGWTEGVSYTLNTIDRPAVLPFVPAPQVTGGAYIESSSFRSGTDNRPVTPQPNDEHGKVPHAAPPGCSGDCIIFEPGSCTRVGGHIWQDGKAPALRADAGDNRPAIALEHHPNDSRVKISEDGIVQTLNARMGTGGAMFHSLCALMFENYQFANWRPGCGTLKASGGDYGGGSENLLVQVSILER